MEAPLKSFDNAKGRKGGGLLGVKQMKDSPFWGFFTRQMAQKEGSFIWFVVLVVFKCRVENVDPLRLTYKWLFLRHYKSLGSIQGIFNL